MAALKSLGYVRSRIWLLFSRSHEVEDPPSGRRENRDRPTSSMETPLLRCRRHLSRLPPLQRLFSKRLGPNSSDAVTATSPCMNGLVGSGKRRGVSALVPSFPFGSSTVENQRSAGGLRVTHVWGARFALRLTDMGVGGSWISRVACCGEVQREL